MSSWWWLSGLSWKRWSWPDQRRWEKISQKIRRRFQQGFEFSVCLWTLDILHSISFLRVGSVSELLSDEERCGGATDDYYWTHWVGAATLSLVCWPSQAALSCRGGEDNPNQCLQIDKMIFVFELFFSFFGIQVILRLQCNVYRSNLYEDIKILWLLWLFDTSRYSRVQSLDYYRESTSLTP